MPIKYYKGLSLEQLAEQLSININLDFQKSANPLNSSLIVIPNTNIRTWLQLKIAKLQGVSLNLTFEFFESMIVNYFLEKNELVNDQGMFESKLSSQYKILNYLLKEKESKLLLPFSKYLDNITRAFSLSSKIRSLLDEYEFNRPNWIIEWAKEFRNVDYAPIGKSSYKLPQGSDTSEFQIQMYKEIFLTEGNEKIRTNQFLLKKENRSLKLKTSSTFPAIHIFCLSNLSELYVQILEEISQKEPGNIYFYQFFTDLPNLELDNLNSSPLRWAKSQKYLAERIESISVRAEFSNELVSNELNNKKNLSLLHDFLHGKKSKDQIQAVVNESKTNEHLRFWSAPSIYREVEAVAHDILNKIQESKDSNHKINFLDISILVTDINLYRPAIEWVFDGGIHLQESEDSIPTRYKIPYSLTDLKGIDNSLLCKGLLDIFSICESEQIKQEDIITIISNPIFGFFNQDSNLDANDIKDILLNLGAYYEEDQRDNDLFQISKSIKRLRMNTIFSGDYLKQNLEMEAVSGYTDIEIQSISLLWYKILNTKKNIKYSLGESKLSKESIFQIFLSLESIFQFEDEFEREASNLQEWFDGILEWENFEFKNYKEGIEVLKLLTSSIFDRLPYRHGSFLIEGVSISLLQPMRPIPFEHVYILGLGEGKFPGKIDHSKLDLRKKDPKPWDSNKIEIQESLLWEALHSALTSITLSYVGEDTKEQKVFNPCSHYLELMDAFNINEPYKIPLHSYSNKYLENTIYKSFDFSLRLLHDVNLNKNQILPKFEEKLLENTKQNSFEQIKINLNDLSKYLADPLDSYLKKQLGMFMDESKIDTDGYEIFTLQALDDSSLFKKIYPLMIKDIVKDESWAWDENKIKECLDVIIKEEQRNSKFPQSIYSELQRQSMLGYLITASEIFASWKSELQGGQYYRTLSIGDTGLRENSDTLSNCKKLKLLVVQTEYDSLIQLAGEWNNVIQKDNKLYWLNIGTLESIKSTKEGNFIKQNAFSFLSALAINYLGENLCIFSMKSRPKDSKKDCMKLDFSTLSNKEEGSLNPIQYLSSITNQYLNKDPILFSRKAFEEYYEGKIKSLPVEDFINDDLAWKRHLIENSEEVVKELSSLSRLYPNIMNFMLESNPLDFAKKYYQPIFENWKPIE
ncbi:MAG: exodeoxyribonuclease V subunit gamma [Leptospiraceae bacterium]|nr:exodeoxyribonuclease V subunit gamma [Leptospiraceae bacterium]